MSLRLAFPIELWYVYWAQCIQNTTVKKMGRLIGPGGSNLRIMMELVPGSFVQSAGPKGSGLICVYAPDEVALGKVLTLIKPYQ